MLKKILLLLFVFLFFTFNPRPVLAEEVMRGHLFYGRGCPHCAEIDAFLMGLEEKYDFLEIKKYEIYYNPENAQLLQEVATKLKVDGSGVPILIIGEKSIIGYLSDETTGREIEEIVLDYHRQVNCPDLVDDILCQKESLSNAQPQDQNVVVSLPLIGKIDARSLSLPMLTVVLGFLDGFNPCAMWILLFLISLLLGMKDKRKMWVLGITFIVTSAAVYFLFMAAWLNLFLFLGVVGWVRLLIGLVALGSGAYYLRDFWINKDGACQVIGREKREKWFERMRSITKQPNFVLAMLGIIALAFAVNLVELICSAGLPAIYTKTLTLSQLPVWQYYAYLLLYIFIFLLDDLFVFIGAMLALQAVGIQGKYARYSHLVGGVLMVLIGILMIFKPEVLMLG